MGPRPHIVMKIIIIIIIITWDCRVETLDTQLVCIIYNSDLIDTIVKQRGRA